MVLENKLGICTANDLVIAEESISKKRAIELFQCGYLKGLEPGTFNTLTQIHRFLFESIYDFAGHLRTVDIAKGGFRFAPVLYLKTTLATIEKMPQSSFDQIIEKYVEMNIAHPFREGNGRSTRIWLDHILKHVLGMVIDWSQIGKDDYLNAMQRSPIDNGQIKRLLKPALTDKINDLDLICKGIDQSYKYEDMSFYKTIDLIR